MGFCFRCVAYSNAMAYNPSTTNVVHRMAKKLSEFFETRWKTIEKKLTVRTDETTIQFPTSKKKKTLTQYDSKSSSGGGLCFCELFICFFFFFFCF